MSQNITQLGSSTHPNKRPKTNLITSMAGTVGSVVLGIILTSCGPRGNKESSQQPGGVDQSLTSDFISSLGDLSQYIADPYVREGVQLPDELKEPLMNSGWEIFGVEGEKSDRGRIYGLRFDIDGETVVVVADVWGYKNHPDLVDPVTMPLGAALDPRPSRKDWENGVVNTTRSPATIAVMESLGDMEEYVATQPQQILNKEALATEPKLPRELADRLTQAGWEVGDKPSTEESRGRVVALVWDDYYDQTVVLKIEVRGAGEDGQKRVEIGTLPIESALEPSHSEEG